MADPKPPFPELDQMPEPVTLEVPAKSICKFGKQVKVGVVLTFGFCSMPTTELSVATHALLFFTVKKVFES